jgi:hypothetical protein
MLHLSFSQLNLTNLTKPKTMKNKPTTKVCCEAQKQKKLLLTLVKMVIFYNELTILDHCSTK